MIRDNTHLWFLLTLFEIFVVAGYLELKFPGYYRAKLLFAFLANIATALFGWNAHSMLRMLFWFYCGYCFEQRRKRGMKTFRRTLISILVFGAASGIKFLINLKEIETVIFEPIMALSGSYIIYTVSIWLANTRLTDYSVYRVIKNNSMSIYLYAEPINFIILSVGFGCLGNAIFASPILCTCLFLIRIFVPLLISILLGEILRKCGLKYIC